jgi:hypothetical protein
MIHHKPEDNHLMELPPQNNEAKEEQFNQEVGQHIATKSFRFYFTGKECSYIDQQGIKQFGTILSQKKIQDSAANIPNYLVTIIDRLTNKQIDVSLLQSNVQILHSRSNKPYDSCKHR